MRSLIALSSLLVLATGCHKTDPGNNGGGADAPTASADADTINGPPDLDLVSTDVVIPAQTEITYCYYFHTPNTTTLAIKKWVSHMTPGSHHMILYFEGGNGTQPADGTLDSNNCGALGSGGLSNLPVWVYSSQVADGGLDLPTDDGTGQPLGMDVAPNTAAYFQMHYLNTGDTPLTVHVELKGYAHPAGTAYTKTAAYITYNGNISIPQNATNYPQTETCSVPAGVKFWTISTHAHKQDRTTDVLDGSAAVFHSTDWAHPGSQSWMTTPFYTFASGSLTYTCTYDNIYSNANSIVHDGPSAQTDEMCMAVGYYFPAPKPRICYTNILLP